MPTTTQTTIVRQFVAGRAVRPHACLAQTDGVTVHFQFRAPRKRPGAVMADQTVIAVSYVAGADLYDVEVLRIDGRTLDRATVRKIAGLDGEQIARVAA